MATFRVLVPSEKKGAKSQVFPSAQIIQFLSSVAMSFHWDVFIAHK